MYFSKASIVSALSMASVVSAHTTMFSVWVNSVDQGDGRKTYIRSPDNNNPVKVLSSPDLVCNVNGGTPVPEFVSAAAGDKLTFEWQHNTRGDDIIDKSHKGPIITYIAEYTETNGASPIWSKIAESGYEDGKWATDVLIANKGKYDFTLPSFIKAGKYLIRQEIIALHEADVAEATNSARGAQFYPSCVQFEVTGSGTVVPDEKFDFNTGYTSTDPGIVFNVYGSVSNYPIPGPAVISGTSSGSGSGSGSNSSAPAATTTSPAATSAAVTSVASTTPAASVTPTSAPVSSCKQRRAARAARRAALAASYNN
ncbi:hypothetical protein TD95_002700 [Thielaviopsis punctulata]|uniref:lytic cellulose monooxygenase (C4-dehydrogenating) n=1 Tax=Thielaviopsis punctulata TaxID=72032 RepID=A0A0F4Z618_9PEZI|nr:hypothetical protein TD95_002700 [Thielaviopsis punctulata]